MPSPCAARATWREHPIRKKEAYTVSKQHLPAPAPEDPGRFSRATAWVRRRRNAVLSSALRGAAYATGGGIVGLAFWWLQQQL